MSKKYFFTDKNGALYSGWEQKELGEVADFINGFAFKPDHLGKEGITVVKIKELLNPSDLSVKTTIDVPKSLHLKNGDIIFSWSMTLACRVWSGGPAFLNQHLYKVVAKENYDDEFLNHLLNNELSGLRNLMHGGTAKHITRKDLLPYKVMMPSLPEQQKIAEFFSALDERIALTADKVKLLKEQKMGYLQRVFNRELVFTGDAGDQYADWEQKNLGDLADIIGGGTPSTGETSYWDGTINWFSPTDVGKSKYLNESTRKITEEGLKNSSAKIHPKGTVLLTTRATLGRMGILLSEAATNQGFQSLLPKNNTIAEFLYYLQSQISVYCDVKASGSTFKEISGKELAKMPVKLPSLPEQEKIAEFFSTLDEQIELTENKLTLLKEQKKGYLQGIFG